ncbi:uncharacterized protein LOC126980675 [Eriocheir sinensis]|uniref:uncharacterized protein LOC126980675 n=1 Tax=Eriocheir sinensis TaxID=95602 RepID=UPI0021C7ABA6|nr:uncharacterized protein LOC126980675 [Eriocheir sinensis]
MARRGAAREAQDEEPRTLSCLQPEILPVQIMIDVLQERGMKAAVLQQADREKIIHLFYKYITPKYQRDCRDNRRGRLMKKIRERKAIRLKDDDWKTLVTESKSKTSLGLSTKLVANNGGERLKPPPSCINTEKKVIKLGATAKASAGDLDFVIIKRKNCENNDEETSTKKQKLFDDERKIEPEKNSEKHEIDDHESITGHEEPMENKKKPKLDRKPISWP